MEKKIIAVIGATGAQGGSLVRAIAKHGKFAARAITRKVEGEKADALRKLGAEVVAADMDDVASLEQAFAGAHGAFTVTSFWEHMNPEKEMSQAKNMARAAKAAKVGHVIWSTLDDTRKRVPLSDPRMPTLHGKYKVPHFDAKGEADGFFVEAGVPTTFLQTTFYWDNFIYFGSGPRKGEDGKLSLTFPMADKRLSGIASEDIGKCAHGVFERGSELVGKYVAIAGEHLTCAEIAAQMSKAIGQEVTYNYVPPEIYRTFPFPGADDLANMFQYYRDFEQEFCGARDLDVVRTLNPELLSFSRWLELHGSKIPIL